MLLSLLRLMMPLGRLRTCCCLCGQGGVEVIVLFFGVVTAFADVKRGEKMVSMIELVVGVDDALSPTTPKVLGSPWSINDSSLRSSSLSPRYSTTISFPVTTIDRFVDATVAVFAGV